MKKITGKLFIVTGLSGAGKTTLVNSLLEKKTTLKKVVSYTTRSIRPHERPGEDYFFVRIDEFIQLRNEGFFIETVCYGNNFYGTPRSICEDLKEGRNLILVTDIQGALFFKRKWRRIVFLVFIWAKDLIQRLLTRGSETKAQINLRAKINKIDFLIWKKNHRSFCLSIDNQDFNQSLNFLKLFFNQF